MSVNTGIARDTDALAVAMNEWLAVITSSRRRRRRRAGPGAAPWCRWRRRTRAPRRPPPRTPDRRRRPRDPGSAIPSEDRCGRVDFFLASDGRAMGWLAYLHATLAAPGSTSLRRSRVRLESGRSRRSRASAVLCLRRPAVAAPDSPARFAVLDRQVGIMIDSRWRASSVRLVRGRWRCEHFIVYGSRAARTLARATSLTCTKSMGPCHPHGEGWLSRGDSLEPAHQDLRVRAMHVHPGSVNVEIP